MSSSTTIPCGLVARRAAAMPLSRAARLHVIARSNISNEGVVSQAELQKQFAVALAISVGLLTAPASLEIDAA